eukprot:1327812-Prymnesium_polylepis.3
MVVTVYGGGLDESGIHHCITASLQRWRGGEVERWRGGEVERCMGVKGRGDVNAHDDWRARV